MRPRPSRGYVEVCYNVEDPHPLFLIQPCLSFSYAEFQESGFNIHISKFEIFIKSPPDHDQPVFKINLSFIYGACIVCFSAHHFVFDGHGACKIIETFVSYCNGKPNFLQLGGLRDRLSLLHGTEDWNEDFEDLDKFTSQNGSAHLDLALHPRLVAENAASPTLESNMRH